MVGGTMLSKCLIQFSVDGQGCVPSLLFDLRPNYAGGIEGNGDLLQSSHAALPQSAPRYPAAEIQLIFLCVGIVLCIYDKLISCPLQKEYLYFFHSNLYTFYFIVLPYCIMTCST